MGLFLLTLLIPMIGTAILCTVDPPIGVAHSVGWLLRWPGWAALLAAVSTLTVAIAGFVVLWILSRLSLARPADTTGSLPVGATTGDS